MCDRVAFELLRYRELSRGEVIEVCRLEPDWRGSWGSIRWPCGRPSVRMPSVGSGATESAGLSDAADAAVAPPTLRCKLPCGETLQAGDKGPCMRPRFPQKKPRHYWGTATLTIGAEVGWALPPRGSTVTITVFTPCISGIAAVARPFRSGAKRECVETTLLPRCTQA